MVFHIYLCGVRKSIVVKKIKSFCMAIIILLSLPVSAQALGMGVPVLKSHLNEILDVRVPLLLAKGESLNNIFIEFAKPNEYRLVGLEPYTDLSGLRISVEHMQHGELYIFLSSVSVVQAPIISLLLKARIGHNTYYKQVQLLLDTMELGTGRHAIKARVKSQSPRLDNMTSKAKPDVETEQGWARTWRYGPVRSGDSLSTIAYRLRRDKQWSNHDVILALYRFNANAFIEHDINRLKSGVWLEIPREKALKELLKQAPEPYENLKRKSNPPSKKLLKPMVKPEAVTSDVKKGSPLRYVGRIALGNDEPILPLDAKATSSAKDSVQLQQQLDQLYQQAMNNHLQMASLDQNLIAIRDDIGKLSNDIVALKEQQNIMQQQMTDSPSTHYWMLGFLLLCLLNIILLGAFLYRRHFLKKKEKYDIEEVYFKKKVKEPVSIEEPVIAPTTKKVRKKHILENKIFDLENYLNLRDYDAAENILKQLNQTERDHFAVCALKVRLYHETGRLDERDTLIRNKQALLNDKQWHLLCDRLPINIWHALHESGVIKDNGTLLNVEENLDYTHDEETASEIDILSAGKKNINTLQSDITAMKYEEEPALENVKNISATAILKSNEDFLELDDIEVQGADEGDVEFVTEDEFVSTVFINTLDGKKKLL